MKPSDFRPHEAEFLRLSRDILKEEWDRVKGGEPTFKIAKYASAAMSLAFLLLICAALLLPPANETKPGNAKESAPAAERAETPAKP